MTPDSKRVGHPVPAGPAELGERLLDLKQRARRCRRVARSSGDPTLAAALDEMAARIEAEIVIVLEQATKG